MVKTTTRIILCVLGAEHSTLCERVRQLVAEQLEDSSTHRTGSTAVTTYRRQPPVLDGRKDYWVEHVHIRARQT